GRETLEEAKRRALISPSVELSQPWGVAAAFKAVHGMSLAEAAKVMGQAGRDLILENPGLILRQSVRDCYRTMFMPDSYYRVVPGETPPEMFDMDEAIAGVTRFAGPTTMEKYLPMDRRPTLTSPLRGRITRWYRRHIEKGSPVVGLLDTPYEEFMLFCLLGGLLSLRCPNRMFWIMLGVVVLAHVVCSAFLGGLHPRYAVPVHPLLHIFGAFALIRCVQFARWVPRAAVSLYVGRRVKPARSP
ncbi:MAG: hypothetical protein IIB60_05800, partial [Planctomycetes bacterium]|nr:hypothetical protein [Planctomycetota bacterium]